MILSGLIGNAYSLFPRSDLERIAPVINGGDRFGGAAASTYINNTTDNNKVYFFSSDVPTDDELWNIAGETELLSLYQDSLVCTVENLTFRWIYDANTRRKMIRKVPVDALDMTTVSVGTIKWATFVLTDHVDGVLNPDETFLMFTSLIGAWNTNSNVITLDKLTSDIVGDTIIFKDLSFKFRDKTPYEKKLVDFSKEVFTNEDTELRIPISFPSDEVLETVEPSATNATVTFDNTTNEIVYTPFENFFGTDIIQLIIKFKGFDIFRSINVNIGGVNDLPVVTLANILTFNEDSVDNLVATISDIEGIDTTNVSAINGTVTVSNGNILYTPNENFNGTDTITVSVTDTDGATTTVTINVTIEAVNDTPIIIANNATTQVNTSVTIPVTITDDSSSYTVEVSANNATVSFDTTTNEITYTPNTDYIGDDEVTINVTDTEGLVGTKTITVTVEGVA